MKNIHEKVEKNVGLFFYNYCLCDQHWWFSRNYTPLFSRKQPTTPVDNLKPYTALEMEGRDIYIREGCHVTVIAK